MRHPLTASRTQIPELARLTTVPAAGAGLHTIMSGVVIACSISRPADPAQPGGPSTSIGRERP
jgi:hypothetical protein